MRKKLHVWALNSRGPVYTGTAQSALRNKRAYRWKATSGSKRITEMLVLEERNLVDTRFEKKMQRMYTTILTQLKRTVVQHAYFLLKPTLHHRRYTYKRLVAIN